MSFIRVKEIGKRGGKKYRYSYLVENKWRKRLKGGKKGSRQKVSKYLGKVLIFDKVKEMGFFEFINVKDNSNYLENSKVRIVEDLARYELLLRGFEKNSQIISRDNVRFDSKSRKFVSPTSFPDCSEEDRIVIEMNEGFLCKYTLNKLINFKAHGDDEREIGIELAKTFLEAGLNVPKEIFVGYFGKL